MSLVVSKNFAATTAIVNYSVFLTPGSVLVESPVGSATSGIVTANVTGGVEPFTYQWTRLSGDPITVNFPTAQQTTFSANSSNGQFQFAEFEVEVTDSDGPPNVTTTAITVVFSFEP